MAEMTFPTEHFVVLIDGTERCGKCGERVSGIRQREVYGYDDEIFPTAASHHTLAVQISLEPCGHSKIVDSKES